MTDGVITSTIANLLAAWNAHDIEQVLTFYAPDYQGVDIGEAVPQQGLADVRQSIARYLAAFPDLSITNEGMIVQANQVALVWTAQGTHRGSLMNIPPTGRLIQVRGVSVLTISDGKISKALRIWDVAGLLRGLGLLPDL